MLSVVLAVLVGFILSAVYLNLSTSRQAKSETLILGESLALQSELLIRPLVLSNDRISLNYLLNELSQLDHLNGLQVQDDNGVVIARSGNTSDLKQTRRLLQQDKTIGTITLWLNATPAEKLISSQHTIIAILACLTTLFILFAIWFASRKAVVVVAETKQQYSHLDFAETLAMQDSAHSLTQANDRPEPAYSEEPPVARTEQITAKPELHSEPELQISAVRDEQPESQSLPFNTEPKEAPKEELQEKIAPEPARTTADIATDLEPTTSRTEPQPSSPKPTREEFALTKLAIKEQDQLQTRELVDLLKPEQSSVPQMPKFEHHPQDLEPESQGPETETLVFEEETAAEKTEAPYQPSMKNPLFKMEEDREEVQLDLYSFEQELELILAPQDAIYLFYLDTNTASSDNITAAEKSALINVYQQLAKQVARIYNGEVEQLENQDLMLRFELRDDKDSHGVNALCAAMLFNLLYKGFNQARIRGFQPVLSLQMSLARGHHSKYNLVKEEAHFLTRTTNSNDLISHTALTEAPLIKEAMLSESDIRREDEDKVLLLKVTPKHQTLLQKQANHLLTKIFKKS
ncbi:hypothetical protein [Neptuniibacter sp.]|uniref:hypothetical protein n=1 Tax=Neptuniibacter sp. TaxID=1962643 RepID=UPI0026274CF8|nr:hypothetical protein [Neptuniibacter sp.]MCP4598480.1 hypothetical protein [Neptuniibacter sp.]